VLGAIPASAEAPGEFGNLAIRRATSHRVIQTRAATATTASTGFAAQQPFARAYTAPVANSKSGFGDRNHSATSKGLSASGSVARTSASPQHQCRTKLKSRQPPFAVVLDAEQRALPEPLTNPAYIHLQESGCIAGRETRVEQGHVIGNRDYQRILVRFSHPRRRRQPNPLERRDFPRTQRTRHRGRNRMIPQRFVLQQPPPRLLVQACGTSTVSESFIVSPPVATLIFP